MPTNDWFANIQNSLGIRVHDPCSRGRYAIRVISLQQRDKLPDNVRVAPTPMANLQPGPVDVLLEVLRPGGRSRGEPGAVPNPIGPTIWLVEQPDLGATALTQSKPEFRITGLSGAFTTYVRLEDAVAAVLRHEQPDFRFAVHQLDRKGRPKDRPV